MQNVEVLDCLVVGAGQSGLMMGYLLKEAGFHYQIVDKALQCGGSWHQRPASLQLFTPRRFSGLTPMPMLGNPNGFPNSIEMAQYLMAYANQAELKVKLGCGVVQVSQNADGFFRVHLQGQEQPVYAKSIVNAAGSNQVLSVPKWAVQLPANVQQLRAEHWEQALLLKKTARVLVVGDGAWGRLAAFELAKNVQVILACGKKRKLSPRRLLGRSVFCWLDWLGILRADKNSWVAKFLRLREPIPMAYANNAALRRLGVTIGGRAVGVEGDDVLLVDAHGNTLKQGVDAVVWCAGYHEDNAWLQLEKSCEAALLEGRGRCAQVPGLFIVGRKWLTCKASELIMGLESDARLVLSYVDERVRSMPSCPATGLPTEAKKTMEFNHA